MITYRVGNAMEPVESGPILLAHICNDLKVMGGGIAGSIARQWPNVFDRYAAWFEGRLEGAPAAALGLVQAVKVKDTLWVMNMIAQHKFPTAEVPVAVQYDKLRACLGKTAEFAKRKGARVVMPRIGCGIAGGTWAEVGAIVEDTLVAQGVPVTVYDFPAPYTGP